MNFEYLVQRYIDGEITPTEDLQLQQLLKESPYLRSQFDNIVHIQHAFSQSTKPLLNEKDSEAIFDTLKIAMVSSIATTAHAPMTTSTFYAAATNIVLPLLMTLFFVFSPNNATSPLLKYVAFQAPINLVSSIENVQGESFVEEVKTNKSSLQNGSKLPTNTPSLIAGYDFSSFEIYDDLQQEIPVITTSNELNEWASENNVEKNNNSILLPIETKKFDEYAHTSILPLTPFVSYNVPIKFEFTISASSQNTNTLGSLRTAPVMSQYLAINYGIDEVNRFGIEFGSTSFVGLALGAVTKPQTEENSYSSGIQNATNSNDETPENPIDNSKTKPTNPNKYYCEDIEFRKDIQIFQSSVFYERELFETSLLCVNSRVGVGVTNIGITSYTKTIVEIKPNDNFSIFGGAEYRVLTGNTGSALQEDTRASSMMSIQTGITIKF